MPMQLIADSILALIDLLRIALITAIPAFLLVLAGQALFRRVRERMKLSWIQAALLSSFAIILPIVFVAYLIPFWMAVSSSSQGTLPEFLQPTALDLAMAFFFTVAKNLISAAIYTVLLMPLLFVGAFIGEKLKERFKLEGLANLFAAVYLTCLVAWVVVFFVFPWIFSGMLYLLYWGTV